MEEEGPGSGPTASLLHGLVGGQGEEEVSGGGAG